MSFIPPNFSLNVFRKPTDAQSLLPEVTVSLAELSLSGTLQLDTELIPDYPFVGNASISFLFPPEFGISIYSLGGVELSSLPGIDQWLNGSITWLLSQYTTPRVASINLQLTLCPTCGDPPNPSPAESMMEKIHQVMNGTRMALIELADQLRGGVKAMKRLSYAVSKAVEARKSDNQDD